MTFVLGDIFIGDYSQSQGFGVNPQAYAQFGLKGHNGIDLACPSNTQIVAAQDGWVKEVGSDPAGYGNYIKLIHNGYLTLYAHLDHAVVRVNDKVVRGQLIGLSDNTGNSTGPHLHFGVAPCDTNGEKTQSSNGYAGYIDPNTCKWDIKNLKQPVSPTVQPTQVEVESATFEKLVANSNTLDQICDLLKLPRNSSFEEVKKKIDEKTTLYEQAETELTKANADAAAYLDELGKLKTDDSNLGLRNLQLSTENNNLHDILNAVMKKANTVDGTKEGILSAIDTLVTSQEQVVKQYKNLYNTVFTDFIYKRVPKAKGVFSWLGNLIKK